MRRRTVLLLLISNLLAASIAIAFPLPGPIMRSHLDMPVVESVDIVLYRNMAWVREVRRQVVPEGTSDVALHELPYLDAHTPKVRAIDDLGRFDVLGLDYGAARYEGRTSATVTARVDAQGGDRRLELSYMALQLQWSPSYELTLPSSGSTARLTTSAYIVNQCGRTFSDANVHLVSSLASARSGSGKDPSDVGAPEPIGEPSDGDQRPMLELQGFDIAPASVRSQETKLVDVTNASAVPVRVEHFVSFNRACGEMPRVEHIDAGLMVAFRNDRASGLGDYLAGGELTVKSERADGVTELIGRTEFADTPPGEIVRVYVGNTQAVMATRMVMDVEGDRRSNENEWTHKVVLTNRMSDPVVVSLRDPRSLKIVQSTHTFTGRGSEATCAVPIAANSSVEVVYTARYRCR